MSLQIWLPLDGDLHNQGLSVVNAAGNISNPTWGNGKIGKCLSISSQQSASITVPELANVSKFSIALWIKMENKTQTGFLDVLSINVQSKDNSKSTNLRLETYTSGAQVCMYGNTVACNGAGQQALTVNYDWAHICYTYDGQKSVKYLNGKAMGTYNYGAAGYEDFHLTGTGFYLGNSGIYTNINDVRIYDHCLSAKEVEELSLGLVLHYPMMMPNGDIGKYEGGKVVLTDSNNNNITTSSNDDIELITSAASRSFGHNTVYDASGYRHNATYTDESKPSFDTDTPLGLGSYKFDGTGAQWISYKDMIQFTNNFSWSCWIKPTVLSGSKFILSQGRDSTANGFNIFLNGASLKIHTNAGSTTVMNLATDTWYHIATSTDTTNIKVYVNGELKVTSALPTLTYDQANGGFVIGKMSYGYTNTSTYFPFTGNICDVRVYATALSAEDIERLYKVKATIDNDGNLYFYSVIENASIANSSLDKAGLLRTSDVSEEGNTGKMFKNGPVKATKIYEFV